MNRGVARLASPMLLGTLIIGCGDNNSSPTNPSSPSGAAPSNDTSLTAPTIEAPALGAALEEIQPELVAGNAAGGSGARTYTFELALDSAFQQMVQSESGIAEGLGGVTKWRVNPLEAATKYHWRVKASTSAGDGPYSTPSEFRTKSGFLRDRDSGGLVLFDPLTSGSTVGQLMGGRFVEGGWQPQKKSDCIRYQIPVLREGIIEFETTNVSSPNPVSGKRMLISMWDPSKGDYTTNPFRMHLQKLDRTTVKFDDVRLRWISRGQETNTGISFFDFEPDINYSWRIEWGTFPGIPSQHVKVFLDGFEILSRNYDRPYSPNPHWVELGNCQREETLEQAIWSNVRIGSR